MSRTINNYTGVAKPVRKKDGSIVLVASTYGNIPMYSPCLKMKDGVAIGLGLGGFREETTFSELTPKREYPVVIEN